MDIMVQVVAALIWRDEKFMICQRPLSKTRALQWEFVGGKVEKGETLEQALNRECIEEIGVGVEVGSVFPRLTTFIPISRFISPCLTPVLQAASRKCLSITISDLSPRRRFRNMNSALRIRIFSKR